MGVAKLALRDQLLAARKRLPLGVLVERARPSPTTCSPLRRYAGRRPSRPTSRSPASPAPAPCSRRSALAGKRVILPVLQPDFDLDWAAYAGPAALHTARRGLLEPDGPTLGRRRDRQRRRRPGAGPGRRPRRHPPGPRRRLLRPGPRSACAAAPSSACCSTPRRSSTRSRTRTTTAAVSAVATELTASPASSTSSSLSRRSLGSSTSRCSVAVLDGLPSEGPRQGPAVHPERGLVAVVPGRDVPGRAGEVDPARPLEVVEVDDHPHRGGRGRRRTRARRSSWWRRRSRCRRRRRTARG